MILTPEQTWALLALALVIAALWVKYLWDKAGRTLDTRIADGHNWFEYGYDGGMGVTILQIQCENCGDMWPGETPCNMRLKKIKPLL